jgi:hypothetical protein
MKTLQAYIDQKNRWNAIFKGKQYEIRTAQGRQEVADSIDAELSPENLTCDGELSRAEIQKRYKSLMAAATELAKLDSGVKIYELYTGE